ncbi:MAG: ABC transporter substrate-binding protein [Acetobacteraceae bacterium]
MHRRTFLKVAAGSVLAAPAIAQPAKTATLRLIPQSNLTVLDPIWTTATVTGNHGYHVFDTLYSVDSKLQPKPQMAAGHEVSADGRVWRIKLRDGLRFHDGTPVRSIDCVVSLQRWCKRDGLGQLLDAAVDTWATPDDTTLELRLKKHFPLLLDALAKPDAAVPFMMPERLARTDPMKAVTEMIGSGPYRFLPGDFVSGSLVAYARFDGYVPRGEAPDWATGAKVAHFPRVEWNVIPDPSTAASALQKGEADWWERPLNDLLPQIERNPQLRTMIQDPSGRLSLMRLNHLHPPFNDVRIRRAVLTAVKQEDYMRATIGDDRTLWRECRSLYVCGTPYTSEDAGRRLMTGDLDAARRMLDAAGYAGQKVVIISPSDFPVIGPLGDVTAETLKKIGINVDLQVMDWGTVVQRRSSKEPVEKGGWSIFHTTGPAVGYANPAVSSLIRGQGQAGWYGWWNNPRAEEMVREWLDSDDEAAQRRLAIAIQDLALEEVATVPLGQFFLKTAYRSSVTGILQGVGVYPWNVRPA